MEHIPVGSKLVKVPEPLYQIFFQWAQQMRKDRAESYITKELRSWQEENHPGLYINKVFDFSKAEAYEINKRIQQKLLGPAAYASDEFITWGMYVLLVPENETEVAGVTHLIEDYTSYTVE